MDHHLQTPRMPRTPDSQPPSARTRLFDSPFSDYYTDVANSPDLFTSGSPAQKTLLHRLSDLRAQIIRRNPNDQVAVAIHSKIDAIESILFAPESQSRKPAEIDDSGLFIDDEDSDNGLGIGPVADEDAHILRHASYESDEEDFTNTTNDNPLPEVEEVLARVTKVNAVLRERYTELKAS